MKADLFRAQAHQEIDIPGFNNDIISIKVQRPRLLALAEQGEIPNPLMGAVEDVLVGPKKKDKPEIQDLHKVVMLYCIACMVEPTYEEVKDVLTDEQMFSIYSWVGGRASKLSMFRKDEKNGPDHNPIKTQPRKAQPNNGAKR